MHAGCRALPHRSGGGVAAGRSAATVALLASTRALQRGGAAASACSVRSSVSAASTPAGTSCSSYYTAAQPAWRRQIGSTNSGSAAARSVRAFSTASPTPPPPHAAPPPGGGIAWLHDIGFSAIFGRSGDGGDGSSSSMSSSSSNSSDDEDNVNNNAAAGAAADAMPVSNGDGSGPAAAAGGSPQLAAAVERLRAARLDAVVMLAGGLLPGGGLPEWVSRRLDAAYDVHLLQRRACPVLLLGGGTPHKPPVLDARGHVVHEATACADYLIARGARAGDLLKEVSSYDTVGCAAMVAACCMLHAACCMLHAAHCMLHAALRTAAVAAVPALSLPQTHPTPTQTQTPTPAPSPSPQQRLLRPRHPRDPRRLAPRRRRDERVPHGALEGAVRGHLAPRGRAAARRPGLVRFEGGVVGGGELFRGGRAQKFSCCTESRSVTLNPIPRITHANKLLSPSSPPSLLPHCWFELAFVSSSDAGVFDADVYAARLEKEAQAVANWRAASAGFRRLSDFHSWLYADHLCYAVPKQQLFGVRTIKDDRLLASY